MYPKIILCMIEVTQICDLRLKYVRFEVFHGGDYEEWRLLGCYSV
jgi:hypothetical protein